MQQYPVFELRSKDPLFQQYLDAFGEKDSDTIDDLDLSTLRYLLPDSIMDTNIDNTLRDGLLNRHYIDIRNGKRVIIIKDTDHLKFAYLYKTEDGNMPAYLTEEECRYDQRSKHEFLLNAANPQFQAFLAELYFRTEVMDNDRYSTYITAPPDILHLLPDMILGQPFTDEDKIELLTKMEKKLKNGRILGLYVPDGIILITEQPIKAKRLPTFAKMEYLYRSQVQYNWEIEA